MYTVQTSGSVRQPQTWYLTIRVTRSLKHSELTAQQTDHAIEKCLVCRIACARVIKS